jgi:hypothetical protein
MQLRRGGTQLQAARRVREALPQIVVRKTVKNFVFFDPVFVTMRRVSFNMHPWPYVKFM